MERDFLGMGGKVETGGSWCNDSAFVASSIGQKPFLKNMTDLHQFMSVKTAAHEDRLRKNIYDQYSSCGIHPLQPIGSIDTSIKPSPMLPSQKSFSMLGQGTGAQQFTMPVYPSIPSNTYGNSTVHRSHLNVPGNTRMFPSIPMSTHANAKCQQLYGPRIAAPVNQSTNTVFPPRDSTTTVAVPATAQLTIFYGGSVNVYENVSIEKAQEIMSLAWNGCGTGDRRSQLAAAAPPLVSKKKVVEVDFAKVSRTQQSTGSATSPCSTFSSPMSAASHSAAHSGSGSSGHDDRNAPPLATKGETEEPLTPPVNDGPLMLRDRVVMDDVPVIAAVPMARKASLTRFLEKRKERMTNAVPYPAQKAVECGSPGKPTPAGAERRPLLGSREVSRPVGSPSDWAGTMHPNTNLEI